jgi:hypothetical protein
MNAILIYIVILLVLGIPLFIIGNLVWKKSQNAKKSRGAYVCIFRGPEKTWVRLLPARNGLIQKPSGKYLLKKEKNLDIPWPTAGYVIPKGMRIPLVEFPFTGSSFTKVFVGLLVYDIGDPEPRGYSEDFSTDPDTINNVHDSKFARELFIDIPNEMENGEKKKGGMGGLLPWVAIALSAIALILIFIIYTHQGSMASNVDVIKKGLGY